MSIRTTVTAGIFARSRQGDDMTNSAAYVGRVGGLAVALGIGTAMATGQGVALADSPAGVSGPSSNDSSESKPALAGRRAPGTPG